MVSSYDPLLTLEIGIPVRQHPEDAENGFNGVQHASLIADLVVKTKQTLMKLSNDNSGHFQHLRMRTAQDTEMIVTNYCSNNGHEYILVTIQNCKVEADAADGEEEEDEKKD